MRKLTAIIAAFGILGATSLTPVAAASPTGAVAHTEDFSAAKAKKKKMTKVKKSKKAKRAELASTEMSSAGKKGKKAKKMKRAKKMSDATIVYRIAA